MKFYEGTHRSNWSQPLAEGGLRWEEEPDISGRVSSHTAACAYPAADSNRIEQAQLKGNSEPGNLEDAIWVVS